MYLYCSTWYDGAALACVACAGTTVSCETFILDTSRELAHIAMQEFWAGGMLDMEM